MTDAVDGLRLVDVSEAGYFILVTIGCVLHMITLTYIVFQWIAIVGNDGLERHPFERVKKYFIGTVASVIALPVILLCTILIVYGSLSNYEGMLIYLIATEGLLTVEAIAICLYGVRFWIKVWRTLQATMHETNHLEKYRFFYCVMVLLFSELMKIIAMAFIDFEDPFGPALIFISLSDFCATFGVIWLYVVPVYTSMLRKTHMASHNIVSYVKSLPKTISLKTRTGKEFLLLDEHSAAT
uniref:Uncharacterized protein n=1 Tax=Lotharella oceanica TaxID=641309 RepID=A0A7S2X8N1_9EUKA